jgi:hypothetical protein
MAIYLAKFIYGLSPLEQHHKIEKKKEKNWLGGEFIGATKTEPKKFSTI